MSERLEGDRGTHDGSEAGDNDQLFRYGNGRTLLTPREQVRLMIFKATAVREVESRRQMELDKNRKS
jgi:hypothetical protein